MVFQNPKSRSFRVRRGVPQRSVLDPAIFSFLSMISLLLCLLPSAILFMVTIWPFGPSSPIPAAVEATHEALNRLKCRSEYWCLPLISIKSDASLFSVDFHQANLQLNFLLFNFPFVSVPLQLFLGSPSTAFFQFLNMHFCSRPSSSLVSRSYAVSAFPCGPSKKFLPFTYKAFLRPHFTNASPGWFPFLSVTNVIKFKRLHRGAGRTISGYSRSPQSLFSSERRLYFPYEKP